MIDVDPVEVLDKAAAARAVAEGHRFIVAEETRQFRLAAHWADLHHSATRHASDTVLPGTERALPYGGAGTPSVLEFAPAEFGALQEMTTTAAVAMIADALDVRHRLPRLWQLVLSGGVRVWKARKIATHTRHLSPEACDQVDADIDGYVNAMGWGRFLNLLRAKIINADPAEAEKARRHAEAERFVRPGRTDEHGLQTIIARARAGHVRWFCATINRLAEILALEGDLRPLDIRRSEAIGILAQPAIALDYLVRHATDTNTTDANTTDDDTANTDDQAADDQAADDTANTDDRHLDDPGTDDDAGIKDAWPSQAERENSAPGPHDHDYPSHHDSTNGTGPSDPRPRGAGRPPDPRPPDHESPSPSRPPDTGRRDAGPPGHQARPPGGNPAPGESSPSDNAPPDGNVRPDGSGLLLPENFTLEGLDLNKLRPDVVLYLHLDAATFVQLTIEAGRCEGLGPITSSQIRAFCGDDAHVTITPVLDLATIQPVDGYAWPKKTREALHQRTPFDVFPYGTTDSRRMQIDHTNPYRPITDGSPPGQTSLANAGPLTTYHHRVKTFAGWQHCQPRPGTYLWRSPTGQVHLVDHNGTHDLGHDQLAQALWTAAHTHTEQHTRDWIRWAITTARETDTKTDPSTAPPPLPQPDGARPAGPVPYWSNSREPIRRTNIIHRHRRITTPRGTRDHITIKPGAIEYTGTHHST